MRNTQYFQMEFKSVEVKAEDGRMTIEGYASTPDIDSYEDIVEPKAFQNTMVEYMTKYKGQIFLQHISEKIIGKTIDYRIDDNGLWIKAEIYNDIDWVFTNISNKMLDSFSIGFRAISWDVEIINERRIRRITELKLVEISVVNWPANVNARFDLAKSIKSFFDNLEGIKSLVTWAYEVKSERKDDEIKEEDIVEAKPITDEESETEVKEEDVIVEEVVEEIEEKSEEVQEETTETPEEVAPEEGEKEEATQEETKTDDVETAGETPDTDDTEEVKSDEMKALEEQVEALKKENDTFRRELETKDAEIEELKAFKTELEVKFAEKETELKEYLSVGTIETKAEKVTPTLTYNYFIHK